MHWNENRKDGGMEGALQWEMYEVNGAENVDNERERQKVSETLFILAIHPSNK